MTDSPITPENRAADDLSAAIAAADRAVAGLQAAIIIADSLRRPDTALALLMLGGDIAAAIAALRGARDRLMDGAA